MATLTHDKPGTDGGRLGSGLGLALVSAAAFGLAGPLASGLMDAGWSAASAVAARVLVAALVLAPLALARLRGRWRLLLRHAPLLLGFGLIAVAGCQLAYFNAIRHLPVAVALLIEYVSPVAVVGWLWLRRGERPGAVTVVGGLVAAVGLVLVLDVLGSGGSLSVVGVAWAVVAMVGNAFYFVVAADGGGEGADPAGELPGVVLAAGGMLVGGAALLLAGALGVLPWNVSTRAAAYDGLTLPWWAGALVLGVVTAGVAYGTGVAATRRLGSRLASFVALGEVVSALVFAWLLLGEVPRAGQVLGGILVLLGVVLVRLGEPSAALPPVVLEAEQVDELSGRPGVAGTPG